MCACLWRFWIHKKASRLVVLFVGERCPFNSAVAVDWRVKDVFFPSQIHCQLSQDRCRRMTWTRLGNVSGNASTDLQSRVSRASLQMTREWETRWLLVGTESVSGRTWRYSTIASSRLKRSSTAPDSRSCGGRWNRSDGGKKRRNLARVCSLFRNMKSLVWLFVVVWLKGRCLKPEDDTAGWSPEEKIPEWRLMILVFFFATSDCSLGKVVFDGSEVIQWDNVHFTCSRGAWMTCHPGKKSHDNSFKVILPNSHMSLEALQFIERLLWTL